MVFLILGVIFWLFKVTYKSQHFFLFSSIVIIFIITTISIMSPKFSFAFMVVFTSILTLLTLPFEVYKGFNAKQKYFLDGLLHFLNKTLILDYLSVIFVKFFCVPFNVYHKRLLGIFCISLCYIISSRFVFIQTVFWNSTLTGFYWFVFYIILFLGVSVIYFRLLLYMAIFFVFSAIRMDPNLLSPSILFVLGIDENNAAKTETPTPKSEVPASSSDKKFSFINVSLTRQYYRQYYAESNISHFRLLGYVIGICGTAAAVGTFWYSKMQAEQSVIQTELSRQQTEQARQQTEQAKQQTYHTAREADVAAVDAGLLSKEEYFRRHPEDVTTISIKSSK
jgi:hypothetical protein